MHSKTNFLIGIALSIIMGFTAGCSSKKSSSTLPKELSDASLEIAVFCARGFLGGSDYEHYVLNDDILWRECGSVSRANKTPDREQIEGDEVIGSDPNLKIQQRRVENVPNPTQTALKEKASTLFRALKKSDFKAPLPGPFYSLRDPGLLEMHIVLGDEEYRLVTSVDAVAEKESYALEQAHELISSIRAVGPLICDAKTFFGIGRTKK